MQQTSLLFILFLWTPVQDVEVLLDQGYDHYMNGAYDKAIKVFGQAEKLAPDNPEIYFLKGVCLHSINEVEQAVNSLNRAVSLKPDYKEAHQQLGYIYLTGKAPKKAIEAFNKAIAIDEEYAEAYVNRGTAKCMLDDKEGAQADWKKAKMLGVTYSAYMTCD
jgi:Flp pilus assembly protein TadD